MLIYVDCGLKTVHIRIVCKSQNIGLNIFFSLKYCHIGNWKCEAIVNKSAIKNAIPQNNTVNLRIN